MTVGILSARALGDGLLGMVLAHNLHRAGRDAVVLHTTLLELAPWFPWARIEAEPQPREALAARLRDFDARFVADLARVGSLDALPAPTVVFGKDAWDREGPYLRSLRRACEAPLELPAWSDDSGLVRPANGPAPAPRRIALHPTSAEASKNWPPSRWIALAAGLTRDGWFPHILLAADEVDAWREAAGDRVPLAVPGTLDDVAHWLRASEACIATDSGIAHLASAVGVPTLTLFRKASAARFWAPAWGHVATVTAPWRLPGGGGHRLWGRLLSPRRVRGAFDHLMDGIK